MLMDKRKCNGCGIQSMAFQIVVPTSADQCTIVLCSRTSGWESLHVYTLTVYGTVLCNNTVLQTVEQSHTPASGLVPTTSSVLKLQA